MGSSLISSPGVWCTFFFFIFIFIFILIYFFKFFFFILFYFILFFSFDLFLFCFWFCFCFFDLGTGAKFGRSFGLTTCGRPQLKLLLLLLFYDLGLRPVSGAGCRKLQPNLAPLPYYCLYWGQEVIIKISFDDYLHQIMSRGNIVHSGQQTWLADTLPEIRPELPINPVPNLEIQPIPRTWSWERRHGETGRQSLPGRQRRRSMPWGYYPSQSSSVEIGKPRGATQMLRCTYVWTSPLKLTPKHVLSFHEKTPLNKGVFAILYQIWPLNRFELRLLSQLWLKLPLFLENGHFQIPKI